jgi:hypothetical protein
LIVAGFLLVQMSVIWLAANGPFVDESLYIVAGIRVLEGHGVSDGYIAWFNGSPFVWPVIAALGHHLGGLSGARAMAALLSAVTLAAFAKTAENLFGDAVAEWCALTFAGNGLFMALAHFAVYDVAALTAVAVSMWCVSRSTTGMSGWTIGAAIAFTCAVIAKYGFMLMVVPLLGLLMSRAGVGRSTRAVTVFLSLSAGILTAYFWLFFASLLPTSSAAYLDQTFGRGRSHIVVLQAVFGLAPAGLAMVGAVVAWRRRQRLLVGTCLLALSLYPLFHVWSANFVSGQKHVVAGFLFAYLLVGVGLEHLWESSARVAVVAALVALMVWGGVQCYWQDRSWSDTRSLGRYLVLHMKRGDRVVAESSWNYIVDLYPRQLIASPADVIDANYSHERGRLDMCQIPWLVGSQGSADIIRTTVGLCGHQKMLSAITPQYYFDTTRLRLGVSSVIVDVYRLPPPSAEFGGSVMRAVPTAKGH